MKETEAIKHDKSKPAYHLIDMQFLEELSNPTVKWPTVGLELALSNLRLWAQCSYGSLWVAVESCAGALDREHPIESAQYHIACALAHGADKYDAHNWRRGFAWSRLWRAAYGHIVSHMRGELTDEESGLPHLAHAMSALMFLIVHQRDGLGVDDRAEVMI